MKRPQLSRIIYHLEDPLISNKTLAAKDQTHRLIRKIAMATHLFQK